MYRKNAESIREELDQTDLVFIACVRVRDSLKNGVTEGVWKCRSEWVNVIIMVTEDNILTAIPKDWEILKKN